MLHLERILVPVDFSEHNLAAVGQAGELSRRFHSQVTLLHVNEFLVIHPFTGALGFGITSSEAIRAEHLAARQKMLQEFGAVELAGVNVKRMVCSGDPARLIAERAREEHSDLILMPTRGGGVFRRFLLGSVTAKVLHDAQCPIWTGVHVVEPPTLPPAGIHDVLCAVDFGPQSACALQWADGFAAALGANLTVVHAVLEMPPNLPERYTYQWHAESHCGASERLHELLLDCQVRAKVLVVSDGDVPNALAKAAGDSGAGLMVIGRGSKEREGGRLGSQTYSIICSSPCSVVSI